MKTKHLLAAGLALFTTVAFAAGVQKELPEHRVLLERLTSATVSTGPEAGTLNLDYAVRFSNSCVAGATVISPLTIPDAIYSEGRMAHRHLTIAIQAEWLRRAVCPAVFEPVTVTYHTVIRNLEAGGSYEAQILGLPERGETYSTIEVTVGN